MNNLVFTPADILLPKVDNMEKWSVVACDQYTSEPKYWQEVRQLVGDDPSTLNLVFPEIYLSDGDFTGRINNINAHMQDYISTNIFTELKHSLIYVERTVTSGKLRRGIVGMIDLEAYDYNKGSGSLIRATEGTVLERIPPRVQIRQNAPLELPHVMLLIDDEGDDIISGVADSKDTYDCVYDFELMQGGGNIKGYRIAENDCDKLLKALDLLADPAAFDKKYGVSGKAVLQYAVGDGNHSLATAKECYNKLKATLPAEEALKHPARFALVELVNLHDESLEFEAIHRVIFDVDTQHLLGELFKYYDCENGKAAGQVIEYVTAEKREAITIKNPHANLAVGSLQEFIDRYIAEFGAKVDYIHGEDVTCSLAKQDGRNIGFILPCMEKSDLFKTVILDGALPRKTFSMGEACEKRFYLESRKIR